MIIKINYAAALKKKTAGVSRGKSLSMRINGRRAEKVDATLGIRRWRNRAAGTCRFERFLRCAAQLLFFLLLPLLLELVASHLHRVHYIGATDGAQPSGPETGLRPRRASPRRSNKNRLRLRVNSYIW